MDELRGILSVSPVDGRYQKHTECLTKYFSEYAIMKYRLYVEVEYFIALCKILPQLKEINDDSVFEKIREHCRLKTFKDALRIKEIEDITNHDVKAIEYYLKEKFVELGLDKHKEFIHFGLTSQDINNTAFPLALLECFHEVYLPSIISIVNFLEEFSAKYKYVPMLAHTHGQPATPTTIGKEIYVFVERLNEQIKSLMTIPFSAKFGGATGNLNAHKVSYPDIDWIKFSNEFVSDLGLVRSKTTTQIEHYDNLASHFDNFKRINTILVDLCRDVWTYISMEYFGQKVKSGEVGSSAMPHKVNPIDFENAEGNLCFANSMFEFMSSKLPVSRLQRDLTDSTVIRNIGMPIAHTIISFNSILKGLNKIVVSEDKMKEDLNNHWVVVSEAIQTILRREGYQDPYETMKDLTRGKSVNKETIHDFIESLDISDEIKEEMKKITPENYIGIV
jgi:adenylosuccinate lyase